MPLIAGVVLNPSVTFLAITITGNHYIIDAIAGALMIVLVYLLYEAIFRRRYHTALAYARAKLGAGKPAPAPAQAPDA